MPNPPPIPAAPLSYAGESDRYRMRSLRKLKWFSIVCVLALLGIFAVINHIEWEQSIRIAYWEHQCMTFQVPPSAVGFERLASGAATPAEAAGLQSVTPQLYAPSADISRLPICLARFLAEKRGYADYPVVFCHGCISPAGHSRLVTVAYGTNDQVQWLFAYVYSPIGRSEGELLAGGQPLLTDVLPCFQRIHVGQPDPANASRFSIDIDWPDGARGVIDGKLNDDDSVALTLRAATQAKPASP